MPWCSPVLNPLEHEMILHPLRVQTFGLHPDVVLCFWVCFYPVLSFGRCLCLLWPFFLHLIAVTLSLFCRCYVSFYDFNFFIVIFAELLSSLMFPFFRNITFVEINGCFQKCLSIFVALHLFAWLRWIMVMHINSFNQLHHFCLDVRFCKANLLNCCFTTTFFMIKYLLLFFFFFF